MTIDMSDYERESVSIRQYIEKTRILPKLRAMCAGSYQTQRTWWEDMVTCPECKCEVTLIHRQGHQWHVYSYIAPHTPLKS